MFSELQEFLVTEPRLPDTNKKFIREINPDIQTGDTREEIFDKVIESAETSDMALISLYVHRLMDVIDWQPFVKGAMERNSVAFEDFDGKALPEIFRLISSLEDKSIYPAKRLAQPDEVWNFKHGDGIEKAFLFASWIYNKDKSSPIELDIKKSIVILTHKGIDYKFNSSKELVKKLTIPCINK
jgi:hypothetical protein